MLRSTPAGERRSSFCDLISNYGPQGIYTFVAFFVMEWILTDPDNKQYGRRLSIAKFEFKTNNDSPVEINLMDYSLQDKHDFIAPFGYSLYEDRPEFIMNHCADVDQARWIIAECIYESKFEPLIQLSA